MARAGSLLAFALATLGLAFGVEPVPTWYYHLAWWSYVVFVDDLNHRHAGRSLLRDRPGTFLWLAGVSVLWWAVFELWNLRLGNWYYVMSPESRPLRWAGGIFAFATVLPGILETVEFLENRGWPRRVAVAPLAFAPAKEKVTLALGAVSVALPLLWPDLFYPLAWGAAVFLLEPWNRRHARRSFLRDLERGDATAFVRTLLAGLLCGALWEAWNYWARSKWIYTVPVFEDLLLFEMPLLGFLGFPPFAVECLVFVRFLGAVRDGLSARARRRSRVLAVLAGPATAFGLFAVVDPVVVDSVHRPISRMESLPPGVGAALAGAGLESPGDALRALDTPQGRRVWAARTGVSETALGEARDRLALMRHRGLGDARAGQLVRLGITEVADLRRVSPEALAAALRAQESRPNDRFLERRARVWVRGAD